MNIITTRIFGAVEWSFKSSSDTYIRMRSPSPDKQFWRLTIGDNPQEYSGATPDKAAASWIASINAESKVSAEIVQIVLRITVQATLWLRYQT